MIDALNRDHGLGSNLAFSRHASGLVIGEVDTVACRASFFLHGAHVASYKPKTESIDLLFMSAEAVFEDGKPIRGGIPICFPWFGAHASDPSMPAHGLVRLAPWDLVSSEIQDSAVVVRLGLTTGHWQLIYEMSFGAKMRIAFTATNQSTSAQTCELALHTYFDLQDSSQTEIRGLEQLAYLDQLTKTEMQATGKPIEFDQETDRIYFGSVNQIVIEDRARGRRVYVTPENSSSSVVWNPWIAKSQRMADFGDDEYQRMCCVETARIGRNKLDIGSHDSETVAFTVATD